FDLNPRPASIDTPLHAFIPAAHVDHVHPDALIALAASSSGERVTKEIFESEVGWLAWQRPGFDLALRIRDAIRARPGLRGIVLAGHGIICWAETSEACYTNTLDLIARAANRINARLAERPAFGGEALSPLPNNQRVPRAAHLLPRLRASASTQTRK